MKMDRLGRYLAYVYLLRVPLLIWMVLVSLSLLAVPKHARLGSLLRGVFDVSGRTDLLSLLSFFLVTLASLFAAAAVALTARLVLLDGEERFGTGHVPRRPGVRLMYRLLPLLVPVSVIVGVCWETYSSGADIAWWAGLFGISGAVGVFLVLMGPVHNVLWARVVLHHRSPSGWAPFDVLWNLSGSAAEFILYLAQLPPSLSPEGYKDPATGQLRDRHKFAAIQLALSLLLYALLFVVKKYSPPEAEPPVIPTLCLVLILATLLCWVLSALSFFCDRFRVPLLLVIATYGWIVSGLPQGDYFFTAENLSEPLALASPAQILERRAGKPMVLVAASGGGIQAEAWTARVLSGLKQDLEAQGSDYDQSIALVSSVSGGSVGAMFFLDAYRNDGTLPPVGGNLEEYAVVKSAQASSLDEVAWGLVYPDLFWTVVPLFKGISFYPPHLLNGPDITSDRGTALESAWLLSSTLEGATLAKWQAGTRDGTRPAVIFNATIVETGERLLLSTTSMGTGPASEGGATIGRKEFSQLYPGFDVPIPTAARLSATFPYVSPAARIWRKDVFAKDHHIVDGGYYDNYGVATLVEWLNKALLTASKKPSKVIIMQIRASPAGAVPAASRHEGWFFQSLQPLETLESVRGTAQFSRNEVAMDFVTRPGLYGIPVETVEFEYHGDSNGNPVEAPLSWHLTAQEKLALRQEWSSTRILQKRNEFRSEFTQ